MILKVYGDAQAEPSPRDTSDNLSWLHLPFRKNGISGGLKPAIPSRLYFLNPYPPINRHCSKATGKLFALKLLVIVKKHPLATKERRMNIRPVAIVKNEEYI